MNIFQKLQAVMKAVHYIKKDKQVESYQAVTHDNVTAHVRPHFLEQGIILHPTLIEGTTSDSGKKTRSETPILRYVGTYDVAFVNVDDPTDRAVVHIQAHAEDPGDKAPGKALSYACKYAILKVLMIETGENDESRVASTGLPDGVVETWLEDIANASTEEVLEGVKMDAFKAAKDALDLDAHKAFKAAIVKRLAELRAPNKKAEGKAA